MPSAPFGFGGILGGGPVPDVQMPDGLPVSGGKGSPLVDAFLALQGQRIKDAVTAPRDAYTGDLQVMGPDGHPTAEAMDRANGLAGLAMTGSMPFKAPKGALRMFGGGETHDDPLVALSAALGDFEPTVPISTVRRLDPNAPSWDLYHGSTPGSDFARFDPAAAKNPADRGGVFLAPSAETANAYAGSPVPGAEAGSRVYRATVEPGKTSVFDLAHLAETDPAFNARAREITAAHNPANAPLFDDYMNTFRASRAQDKDVAKQAAEMGYDVGPDAATPVSYGHGHIAAAIERAKAQGLDTAVLRGLAEHGMDDQVVALTPGRVRSYYDPSQVLFNGGPAGGLAGLPALAASSDPKGQPVSSGLAPFGALSPADIARLMQQARPQVGDEDVPAAIPPGYTGFVPPTAPTMQPPAAAPVQASEPTAPMQSPLRMFGSLPPQMPAPAASEAAPVAMPSLVGSQAPAMPNRAPAAPVSSDADAPAAPAPARIRTFGSLPVPVGPAPSITGSVPAAGSPAPAPAAPQAAAEPSFFDGIRSGLRSLNANGGSDLLMSLGTGLMSTPGFFRGAAAGFKNYQDNEGKRAASSLAQAEFGLKARNVQQEQGVQNMTARAIMTKMPGTSPEDAVALAGNPDFVKSFLSGNYGAPEGYVRTSNGLVPVAGGPQDPNALKARAQAQAEGTAAGAKDDVQVITRPDGSIVGVNKSRIGEADGPSPLMPVAPATSSTRVWGTPGPDGQAVAPPPGTPPGTPGYYDEKGAPHVALTQGTNQLPQKANAELDQAAVKAITESRAKAEGAIGTLGAINRQKEALDKGIVAGAGADWRTQARAITAQVLGIPDSYVTNSQLFDQAATQKSAELAKAISQAGHTTNMDLQLGKTISSGDRSSVEAALRAGIEAQEILAKRTIEHHNASVDRFATPETAQRAGFFKVEQPEVYQYKPAAPDRSAVESEMRRRGMMR